MRDYDVHCPLLSAMQTVHKYKEQQQIQPQPNGGNFTAYFKTDLEQRLF